MAPWRPGALLVVAVAASATGAVEPQTRPADALPQRANRLPGSAGPLRPTPVPHRHKAIQLPLDRRELLLDGSPRSRRQVVVRRRAGISPVDGSSGTPLPLLVGKQELLLRLAAPAYLTSVAQVGR